MEEKEKYSVDQLIGIVANRAMLQIFKEVSEKNQLVALTAAVSFFTQVLFMLEDSYRAKLLFILDEMSVLMNNETGTEKYLEKMKAFDLATRLEAISQ